MDEVFGTDQSSAAALTIPTTEKNKYDRIFFILIGFTVAAFTGIAAVQFYIQGHAADVRFIMLALIVLSVELFVYVEMNGGDRRTWSAQSCDMRRKMKTEDLKNRMLMHWNM